MCQFITNSTWRGFFMSRASHSARCRGPAVRVARAGKGKWGFGGWRGTSWQRRRILGHRRNKKAGRSPIGPPLQTPSSARCGPPTTAPPPPARASPRAGATGKRPSLSRHRISSNSGAAREGVRGP